MGISFIALAKTQRSRIHSSFSTAVGFCVVTLDLVWGEEQRSRTWQVQVTMRNPIVFTEKLSPYRWQGALEKWPGYQTGRPAKKEVPVVTWHRGGVLWVAVAPHSHWEVSRSIPIHKHYCSTLCWFQFNFVKWDWQVRHCFEFWHLVWFQCVPLCNSVGSWDLLGGASSSEINWR